MTTAVVEIYMAEQRVLTRLIRMSKINAVFCITKAPKENIRFRANALASASASSNVDNDEERHVEVLRIGTEIGGAGVIRWL